VRLAEIMSSPVATVAPGVSVARVAQRMREENVHHMVVVEHGEVIGVISSGELAVERDPELPVRQRITGPPVIATPRTSVKDAANRLRGRGVGCIAVVEDDRLVGVVTIADLLELLGRGAIRPSPRAERWTLKARGPRKTRQKAVR
jgi:acetoin utilization protein AcuB